MAGCFQDVIDRYPILPCGFHAHILAVVLTQPCRTPPQVPGKSGEPLVLIGGHPVVIGRSNTGNDKRFVDIHPTADRVNNFEHNTSLETIFEGVGRDWTLIERLK